MFDSLGLLDGVKVDEHLQIDCAEQIGHLAVVFEIVRQAWQFFGEPECLFDDVATGISYGGLSRQCRDLMLKPRLAGRELFDKRFEVLKQLGRVGQGEVASGLCSLCFGLFQFGAKSSQITLETLGIAMFATRRREVWFPPVDGRLVR